MRRMLMALVIGVAGGLLGALVVVAVPAEGAPDGGGPGDPLLLSRVNQAGPMTVLKSNGGFRILAKNPKRPPLMVYTPEAVAPLQVSSSAKVEHLNADMVDGVDASGLMQVHSPIILPPSVFTSSDTYREIEVMSSGRLEAVDFDGNHQAGGCGVAPVNLPDGASVTNVVANVSDSDGSGHAFLILRRKPIASTADANDMAQTELSSDVGPGLLLQRLTDTTVEGNPINTSTNRYFLVMCLFDSDTLDGGSLVFWDAEVHFTRP